jgi:hypothetical protein
MKPKRVQRRRRKNRGMLSWITYRKPVKKRGKYGRTKNPNLVDAWTNLRPGYTSSNNNKLGYTVGFNKSMTMSYMECDRDWWWFCTAVIKTLLLLPVFCIMAFFNLWILAAWVVFKIIDVFRTVPAIPAKVNLIGLDNPRNPDYKDPRNKYGPNYNPKLMPKGPGWKWW